MDQSDDVADDIDIAYEESYGKSCFRPYKKIGSQCLFFSRPMAAWGISETWEEAYLNYYDATAMCRNHGGDLAERVEDFHAAKRHCRRLRGRCAPSFLHRDNKCFQWSPLDGSEVEIPCRKWEIQMRYICEMKDFEDDK
ncbi:uncharacterized protein LOC131883590 isoform X2 [Tigriopus californicus]|uniref:uncharacterized protein LOC131883590 isoform X2 n=1 Tax=Tigriopus californicus TaxID=6832 RepID=UPI0027DA5F8E|nr:uncharacterized protein LOC131883590 isoform X2 [Tigriopus californicus]